MVIEINDRKVPNMRAMRSIWSPGSRDGTEGAIDLRVLCAFNVVVGTAGLNGDGYCEIGGQKISQML
jgi:hypothetical protein